MVKRLTDENTSVMPGTLDPMATGVLPGLPGTGDAVWWNT